MRQIDFIKNVSNATGLTKSKTKEVLNTAFREIVLEAAKGERVRIPNFGIFFKQVKKGRNSLTPNGYTTTFIKFKISKNIKRALNGSK